MNGTICSGSLEHDGVRIQFEGGPALKYVLRLQRRKNGPSRTRWVTFQEPVLSLAAALWAQKHIEREFKQITIYPA